MLRGKRVLITGASGFVGSYLARYLHEKGFEIWGTYRRRKEKLPLRLRWLRADLTDFREALRTVRSSRPTYVFHLAGQAVPRKAWEDPELTYRLNVGASVFLLEGIARFAPTARVVLVSTSQVYGSTFFAKERVCETDPVNPVTPYGASKLLMELVGLNFFKQHRVDIVIARAFNHVGRSQNASFVFADFCRQVAMIEKKRKRPVLNVGNVSVTRDFVHVRDAARAYHILAVRGKSGEIYNVGSEKGTNLKEVIRYLKKESRTPFEVFSSKSRRQRNDVSCAISDCSKLRRLGWEPRESTWKALQEILEDWRERVK